MNCPCYKSHLLKQTYPLLSAIHTLSLIPCCSNYYNLFCWQIFSLFRIFLSDMQVSDYTQNGNSQMFFLSVLSAHYWDIFCIYMLLTFAATFFLSLDFRYTFLAFLLIHFLHYMQNNHLSKMYVLSRNASANNSDSVSIYGKSYNFSLGLQFYSPTL